MDLRKLMEALKYGAQYLTGEEREQFDRVHNSYSKTQRIPSDQLPFLVDLFKKIQFRQIDTNALVIELENNLLFLTAQEQAAVEGARFTLEYSTGEGQVDPRTIEQLLGIRKALRTRQHDTLTNKNEPAASATALQIVTPRRPSSRMIRPSETLAAAAKLLKKG